MFLEEYSYMAMSYIGVVLGPIILLNVFGPVIIYVIARWRSHHTTDGDTQLGTKVGLSWFKLVSYQLLLNVGFLTVFMILVDIPSEGKEVFWRLIAGIGLPAGAVFAAHEAILSNTNRDSHPNVTRMFQGWSFIQTGIIGFVSLIIGGVLLFQENTPETANRFVLSLALVYCGAWVVQGFRMLDYRPPLEIEE